MTVLLDNQWQLPNSTLLIGPGTPYKWSRITGPGHKVRISDAPRSDGAGLYLGPEWAQESAWTIDLMVLGSSPADTLTKYEALAAAWMIRGTEGFVGSAPLVFKRPGQVQRQTGSGRPRELVCDLSTAKLNYIPCSLTFMAETPFEYSDAEHSYDLVYNGSSVTIGNAGNYPAAVTYDVYGLVTNPGVIRSEAARFDLTTSIGNSDFYRVRTEAKTITRASDAASLYQTWVAGSTWLEIPPGGALFRTVGTGGSGSVKTRMFWRDTWWV